MALITCSECGEQVSSTAEACPHCGAPVSAAPAAEGIKCEECGSVLPEGAAICPTCGAPVSAAPAAEGIKCEECGSVLPGGVAICPTCGCPAGIKPVQPVSAPRPAYIAPTVAPARVQLGSAKLRITEEVNRKIANANAWLFLATAATIVMYLIAFLKYIKGLNKLLDFAGSFKGTIAAAVVDGISGDMATEILDTCKNVRLLLIAALVIAGITFIGGLVKMSKKQLMSGCLDVFPILAVVGFWIPVNVLSKFTGFKNATILDALDFLTKDDFGTYLKVAPFIIVGLLLISLIVCVSIPKVTDFCSHCGRKIKNEGAGGICKGCGERKYIPGFMPIPRDVVAAYPYSGETLVGQSPVRASHIFVTLLATIISGGIFAGGLVGSILAKIAALIIMCLTGLAVTILVTIYQFKGGARDKITVTPTTVKLRVVYKHVRLNVPVSEITDVLTNESGDLAVCARGIAAIFTDTSGRSQIAAALETLTSKNQMN